MAKTTTPLRSAYTRVFLVEGGVSGANQPLYRADLRAMGLTYGFGDSEAIEVPDPAKLGDFVEVGEIRGATERPTTQLQGRYPAKTESDIFRIARTGCFSDIHIVIGACNDPRSYDEYDKLVVFEDARVTNYETDDLGALASGDNAAVNETGDLSGKEAYEVLPVSYGVKAASIVSNEVVDIIICDSVSCGDCEDPSDGCKKIFGITKAAGGSPSTEADIVYSIDGGINWYAHDIESLDPADDPDGIGCIGSYVVVVSEDSESLHYALKSEMDTLTDPDWTEVTTGFVAGKGPRAIWSLGDMAFVVGAGGYIYKIENPTSGASVLDAGSVVTSALNDVHALDDEFAIAVGNAGAVLFTNTGIAWALAPTSPVGYGTNLLCCWAKSTTEWWVGSDDGHLYYTLNAGKTWTEKSFDGSGAGAVYDIKFSTKSVGWISHSTATPKGRILRTTNGGYTWKLTPESTKIFPACDQISAIAVCSFNPNFVIGGGLADDGADGFIVLGTGV